MDHGAHGGMDHGAMDHGASGGHGGMDHGGMDHGGMSSCNMNMVWNWDTTNICILTSSWRITTPLSLYISLAAIAFAGVLYEWLRLYIRRLDARLARSASNPLSATHRRRASLLLPTSNPACASSSSSGGIAERRNVSMSKRRSLSTAGSLIEANKQNENRWVKPLETSRTTQMWRSTLYATSVGISFVLMLISMTFNAYVIAAIVAGAGLGHYWFNRDLSSTNALLSGQADDKSLACHM